MVNRDLKLDNTLVQANDYLVEKPLIKICDFGFSKHEQMHSMPHSAVGTCNYMAPEVIHARFPGHNYDGKVRM